VLAASPARSLSYGDAPTGHRRSANGAAKLLRLGFAAIVFVGLGAGPLLAQAVPPASQSFQAGLDEAVRLLAHEPRLKGISARQRLARIEFVFGNTLFVTTHELGHALVSEMDLPVLGREEDAADDFAILTALRIGDSLSHRVLVEAAKGWFLSAQRDKKKGDAPYYYDRHGLNEQRAYQIVCLMVGSDPVKFKDLADETKLPPERRRSCGWDFDTAVRSWLRVMAPHRRAPDQPKTRIDVVYGEAKGVLELYPRVFSATRFLETVAEHAADRYAWPAPITLEMRTCGESGARWTVPLRKLHVCYELIREFADLHREYGQAAKRPKRSTAADQ
jgi:hypothetical protein